MSDDLLSPHAALIHVMVLMSAADSDMTDRELKRIGDMVQNLPVFRDFNSDELVEIAEDCAGRLAKDGGLDGVLVGVQRGTTHQCYMEKMFPEAELKLYGTQEEVFLDLAAGRIDMQLSDST